MNIASDADWIIDSKSPAETVELGRKVGVRLAAGDVLCLIGDLGAGKTQFTKGIAAGLGVAASGVVTSPTFVLMNSYEGRVPLRHFDLYRLEGGELESLGFHDLVPTSVMVVEWGEKAGEGLGDRLEVRFDTTGPGGRRISFHAKGERAATLLADLRSS